MGQLLESLHQLQEVETRVAAIRRKRSAKETLLSTQQRRVQRVDTKLTEIKRNIRDHQIRADSLSLEVATRDEALNKHRQALAKARTNKEYAAVLTAMNTEQADTSKIEVEALELMEVIQGFTTDAEGMEDEREKLLSQVAAAEAELESVDEEFLEERSQLETDRERLAADIPPSALDLFQRASERHDGEAMAAVTKLRPKRPEYLCSGCNIQVTLEMVSSLQSRDDVQLCHVCRRVLFLDPALFPKKQ